MSKLEEIKEWIRFAEMDRDTVHILYDNYKKPYEIICYHCQQAVEKYLKSCLIMYDLPIIKTHDLTQLNELCASKNSKFEKLKEECKKLSFYAIQVRYPFHKNDLTLEEVEDAIKETENVCEVIIDILEEYLSK